MKSFMSKQNNRGYWINQAIISMKNKCFSQAFSCLDKGIAISDDSTDNDNTNLAVLYIMRGEIRYARLQQKKSAFLDLSKAVSVSQGKSHFDIRFRKGVFLTKVHEFDHAMTDFRELISICRFYIPAYIYIFQIEYDHYANQKSALSILDEAIEVINESSGDQFSKESAQIFLERARFKFNINDYSSAYIDIKQSISFNESNYEAYLVLSEIKQQFGDISGAILACEQAIRIDPANKKLHGMLKELLDESLA